MQMFIKQKVILVLKFLVDICQFEPKKSTNLRSGPKKFTQIPKNKVTPLAKQLPNQTQERRQNQGDQNKAAEIEEVNKNVQIFNFENELCKVNIPTLIHLGGFFHEIFPHFEHSWINTSFFYHGGKTVAISMLFNF